MQQAAAVACMQPCGLCPLAGDLLLVRPIRDAAGRRRRRRRRWRQRLHHAAARGGGVARRRYSPRRPAPLKDPAHHPLAFILSQAAALHRSSPNRQRQCSNHEHVPAIAMAHEQSATDAAKLKGSGSDTVEAQVGNQTATASDLNCPN
uniref:Uncharacterized protein n=1 Tax=Arundo donax TaxID=35708 RepID=A0A0A9DJ98_ARUDO